MFLNKELECTDFEASEKIIELSSKMMSIITEAVVKRSILMDILAKKPASIYDGDPTPQPNRPFLWDRPSHGIPGWRITPLLEALFKVNPRMNLNMNEALKVNVHLPKQ